jgi:hypothetical protein
LIRRDLSSSERADLTARRKTLYEREFPEAPRGRGGDRRSKDVLSVDSFNSDVAAKSGRTKKSIERDAKRGKALGTATLARVQGTKLIGNFCRDPVD